MFDVRASAVRPASAFNSDDLPTLERPAKATSGSVVSGICASAAAPVTNSQAWANSQRPRSRASASSLALFPGAGEHPLEVNYRCPADVVAAAAQYLADVEDDLAPGFGIPELALVASLDWMDFRKTYPTERAAALDGVRSAWRERPSLVASRPHV